MPTSFLFQINFCVYNSADYLIVLFKLNVFKSNASTINNVLVTSAYFFSYAFFCYVCDGKTLYKFALFLPAKLNKDEWKKVLKNNTSLGIYLEYVIYRHYPVFSRNLILFWEFYFAISCSKETSSIWGWVEAPKKWRRKN